METRMQKSGWMLLAMLWSLPVLAEDITVYKSPTCGCCKKWIGHLQANGFNVNAQDVNTVEPLKNQLGLGRNQRSCHTALVGGYLIEGHVPASDIRRLLKEKPKAKGLAVPGMPIGSPGMEQGAQQDPYNVLLIRPDGSTQVYSRQNQGRK